MKQLSQSFLCRISISNIISTNHFISNIIHDIRHPILTNWQDMTLFVYTQFLADNLWMAWDTNDEIGIFIIHINNSTW